MIYAISDIHGCIEELQKQMEQVISAGKIVLYFWETILIMVIAHVRFWSISEIYRRNMEKKKL